MSTISNFDDILNVLEQSPQVRNALRWHILTEEFLQLPVLVATLLKDVDQLKEGQARLESDVAQLKEGQARLESDVAQLKEGQSRLEWRQKQIEEGQARLEERQEWLEGGQVKIEENQERFDTKVSRILRQLERLSGSDYQRTAGKMLRRISRTILNVREPYSISLAGRNENPDLEVLVEEALEKGKINGEEAVQLDLADMVIRGLADDNSQVFLLVEISITVHQEDVDRAVRRAGILQRATGATTIPVVLGTSIEAPNVVGVTQIVMDDDGNYSQPTEQ